jgi:hypothetical protein
MPDHCSSGVWNINGSNVDEEDLPVTPDLITRIKAWQRKFDMTDWYINSKERDDAYREIVMENVAIAIEVAKQLPDWTVVMYNGGEVSLPILKHHNSIVTGDMLVSDIQYTYQFPTEDLV